MSGLMADLYTGALMRLVVCGPRGLWMQPRLVGNAPRAARQIRVTNDAMALRELLDAAVALDARQVWVMPGAALDPSQADVDAATAGGWALTIAQPGQGGGWARWVIAHRPDAGQRQVYYVERDYDSPLALPGVTPLDATRALANYTHALGAFFSRSAGSSGMRLMRECLNGHRYDTPATALPTPLRDGSLHADGGLAWMRDPTARERTHGRWLVALDRNAAWLTAAGMATLGVGAPVHVTGGDPSINIAHAAKAGLFRLRALDVGPLPVSLNLPAPLVDYTSDKWVSKPTLDLIDELGGRYEVAEAYVQAVGHRALDGWYKRLRDARAALLPDPLALALLKGHWVKGLGLLGAAGGETWGRGDDPLYRPDWYATIKALARANMIRKALNTVRDGHLSPIAAAIDCWYYVVEDADALWAHYRRGRAPNEWKAAVYDLADHDDLAAILCDARLTPTRRLGKLRRALVALADEDEGNADAADADGAEGEAPDAQP